jgi:hypothetical protein
MQYGRETGPSGVKQSTELSTASVDKETVVSDPQASLWAALPRMRSR